MEARAYQHYKEQSLNTMTSEELLLLLFDELVKRLHRCDLALEKNDMPLLETSADRCLDILRYLDNTLDMKYPVSLQLHRLYDFFCYELQRVKLGRNREELQKILPMLVDLRETFRTAERRSAQERGGAAENRGGDGTV